MCVVDSVVAVTVSSKIE